MVKIPHLVFCLLLSRIISYGYISAILNFNIYLDNITHDSFEIVMVANRNSFYDYVNENKALEKVYYVEKDKI